MPSLIEECKIIKGRVLQPIQADSASNSEPERWRNQRLSARIVELDGVRGLAVLLIVGFHYFVQSTEVSRHWLAALLDPLHIMVSGVDLFFVLSGFLILVVHPGAIARGVFGSWMLTRLGKYSYAIYIYHYGIFGLSHYFILHHAPAVHDRDSVLVTFLALILTISCAAISWRFMENPLIARAGQRFRYVPDQGNGIGDVGLDANLARPSVSH